MVQVQLNWFRPKNRMGYRILPYEAGSYFSVFDEMQNQDCGSWSRFRTSVLSYVVYVVNVCGVHLSDDRAVLYKVREVLLNQARSHESLIP